MSTSYALPTELHRDLGTASDLETSVSAAPVRADLPVVAARRESSLRLTRRGRAVVLVAGLLLALAAFWLAPGGSSASGDAGTEVVTVGTGQTLWQIASVRAEDGDVREMVEHIKDLNGLDSGILLAGQDLRVPALGR